jgi:16S rRNA (cytosine967-C5)-methyltransferase
MMAQLPFREFHILEILHGYEERDLPMDLWISLYFRAHTAIGSKDRAFIADTLYGLIRWLGTIDYFIGDDYSWERRLEFFLESDFQKIYADETLPLHVRVSFPPELFDTVAANFGPEEALELCYVSNFAAPTTVRVNTLKISRDALLARWQEQFSVSPTLHSSVGITFHKKINFFGLPEFKEGLFEVQDEASQMVANLLKAKPGDLVLDYCSGSGGKTLAFAHHLEGKGQIFLHDIRKGVLIEAQKRL